MTLFWLLAAGMVAVALLFVLPPLLAPEAAGRRGGSPQAQASLAVLREQLAQLQADHASGRLAPDHYAQARTEIERRALREGCAAPDRLDTRPAPRWALAVALGLGAISVGLYAALGNPAALTPADADPHASPSASAGHDPDDPMAERLAGLIQHLQAHPDDTEGWTTLAHTYATLGDFAGGAATWARMGARAPQDPGVLADWADLLATAANGDFSGEPDRLIGRLLALAPDDVKGLALAGTSAFFRGDFHGAIDAWERLRPLVDPDGPVHEQVQASLAQARRAAEGAAADGAAAEGAATDGGAADRTAADRAAAGAEGPAFPPGARASGGRGRQD